jgi:hypothetical protein
MNLYSFGTRNFSQAGKLVQLAKVTGGDHIGKSEAIS